MVLGPRLLDRTVKARILRGFLAINEGRHVPGLLIGERAAINAPMQGTAADLIKMAMIQVQQGLADQRRATRMVMQVHDELVFEVPEVEIPWAKLTIPQWMAAVAQLKVPLVAEAGIGPNWESAH